MADLVKKKKKRRKLTALDIEIALFSYFNWKKNIIVPNIAWGMDFKHELDLFILTPSGYGTEVEIKTSISDLKKEKTKNHNHESYRIKRLYFAFPESIYKKVLKNLDCIPDRAGLLTIKKYDSYIGYEVTVEREAKISSKYKFSEEDKINLMRLGTMRIFTMKKRILKLKKGIK